MFCLAAHCLSHWGHDFRPDYLKLKTLKNNYPGVPITCLTATATQHVVDDVCGSLNMRAGEVVVFKQSFNRPNITYEVRKKGKVKSKKGSAAAADETNSTGDVISQIADWIRSTYPDQSGIIYCNSKADCEHVAHELHGRNISADFYHAGREDADRKHVQKQWALDKVRVIVATIAFGLGQSQCVSGHLWNLLSTSCSHFLAPVSCPRHQQARLSLRHSLHHAEESRSVHAGEWSCRSRRQAVPQFTLLHVRRQAQSGVAYQRREGARRHASRAKAPRGGESKHKIEHEEAASDGQWLSTQNVT
jgi:hypothetical protein